MTDFRYALRSLFKQPGFAAVVVITLALGIGASTAIFSVVNAVLLRPLPFPNSDRLQVVWGNYRALNIERLPAKAAEFEDYAKQSQVFDTVAAYSNHSFNLTSGSEPERIRGAYVSANLFPMLETQAAAGRVFTAEEQQEGRNRVIVLSDGFWRRHFAGDRGIINQSISLDNENYTVVGVMPPAFQFPHPSFRSSEPADVWLPLTYTQDQVVNRSGPYFLNVLARLAPGVTLEQARSHMNALGERFQRELSGYRGPNGEDGGWHISVTPLQEEIVGGSRRALLVLLFAVGLLLLIACANVANLLLMRSAKRNRELAIRAALGASRWKIVRQLSVEGLVLAVLAAALGLVFVYWGVDLLVALGPSIVPRAREVSIDARVFAFMVSAVSLIVIGFGLVAARSVSKVHLNDSLKSTRLTVGSGPRRWSNVLVVAEVSLAVLLLAGSGLLVKSLLRLQQTNPGIVADQLMSIEIDLSATTYQQAERASDFYRRLVQQVQSLPGVHDASSGTVQPLGNVGGNAGSDPFAIEGRQLDPTNLTAAGWQVVGANYLRTLGIPLVRGRDLAPADMEPGAPPVAVINEKMAARYWPNEDPIGRRITLGLPRPDNAWVTIVGIAKDVPHRAIDSPSEPDWYISRVLAPQRHRYLFVRSALPASSLTSAIRHEVAQIDPHQPLTSVRTMTEVIGATTAPRRFNALLLGLFATVALVLATLGIYSVISYSITLRTQEIGIRMALGARRPAILLMVLRSGMVLTLIGAALGLTGALGLTRWMSSLLFGVSATDPLTYSVVLFVALGAALLACWLPARRATRVDPLVALRYE